MLTLGIDTSGKTASCALCSEDTVLAQNTFITKLTHSQVILPMVSKMLSDAGKSLDDVDGFAAISGPGSYTGLRIGISAVKGICFALDKPCAGISALESLAYNFKGIMEEAVVCAVMHARQELVYNAFFKLTEGKIVRECDDRIIPLSQAQSEAAKYGSTVYVTGDYTEQLCQGAKCRNVTPAPPLLRMPLASSLCFAAQDHGFGRASELNAEYMQITKAEKDLLEKN